MNSRIKKIMSGGRRGPRLVSTPVNLCEGRTTKDPAMALHIAIKDALDPTKMDGPVRTLKDMSSEEREELERQYGAKIETEDDQKHVPVSVYILVRTEKAVLVAQGGIGKQSRCWIGLGLIENKDKAVVGPAVIWIPAWKARRARLRRQVQESSP